MTDLELAKKLKHLLHEAEARHPDSEELKALHEAANVAARALLSPEDAAQVGVYPMKRDAQSNSPPSGKGQPPPGP